LRRAALTIAAGGLVVGSLLAIPSAFASTRSDTLATADPETVATVLADRLGSPGTYVDTATGKTVVTVTDDAKASTVRRAGGVARVVPHSAAQLSQVADDLNRSALIPGTAWSLDPKTNQVVVAVDSTVTGAKLDQVRTVLARSGGAARIKPVGGTFTTRIGGGDAIFGGQFRCSLGFNVTKGGAAHFLTAGHCGNAAKTWFANGAHTQALGSTVTSNFPGKDFALVKYTNAAVAHPSNVDLFNGSTQNITAAGKAKVGQAVKRSGSTTQVHSGTVTGLNATVNYAEGTVRGLIQTNVCAEGGDSGGALFAGTTALGLTSGGSGNCTQGGETFFQPVTAALAAVGATLP